MFSPCTSNSNLELTTAVRYDKTSFLLFRQGTQSRTSTEQYISSWMFLFTLTNLFFWLLVLFVLLVFSISSTQALQYDLIVIGGGAGGMFAAGAASSIFQTNKKTAILDLQPSLGGDCSNAACVPSKALRSAARRTVRQSGAQEHVRQAVEAVRTREQPMSERNPNLDVHLYSRVVLWGRMRWSWRLPIPRFVQ